MNKHDEREQGERAGQDDQQRVGDADDVSGFGFEDYARWMDWARRRQSDQLFRLTSMRFPIF